MNESPANPVQTRNPRDKSGIEPSVVLNAEKLTKLYSIGRKDVLALRKVDLQIKRGEFVAIAERAGKANELLGCSAYRGGRSTGPTGCAQGSSSAWR